MTEKSHNFTLSWFIIHVSALVALIAALGWIVVQPQGASTTLSGSDRFYPLTLKFQPLSGSVTRGTSGQTTLSLDTNGQSLSSLHLVIQYPPLLLKVTDVTLSEAVCPAITQSSLTRTDGQIILNCRPTNLTLKQQIATIATIHWQASNIGQATLEIRPQSRAATATSADLSLIRSFPTAHVMITP